MSSTWTPLMRSATTALVPISATLTKYPELPYRPWLPTTLGRAGSATSITCSPLVPSAT